jgi:hypothetical protein
MSDRARGLARLILARFPPFLHASILIVVIFMTTLLKFQNPSTQNACVSSGRTAELARGPVRSDLRNL